MSSRCRTVVMEAVPSGSIGAMHATCSANSGGTLDVERCQRSAAHTAPDSVTCHENFFGINFGGSSADCIKAATLLTGTQAVWHRLR